VHVPREAVAIRVGREHAQPVRPARAVGRRQVPVPPLLQPSEGRRPRISAEEEEGFTPRGLFKKNMRAAVCGGGVLKGVLNGGRAAAGF
jgi:hypothetical protein